MTGIHLVQIYGHTAQGASTSQVNAICRNLKMGTVMGRTQACAMSTAECFLVKGESRKLLPESNESASGSRCGVASRKVWRKKAPILARTSRRWNKATGPISAPICTVLEAGWRANTPGFWQTPDASATLDGALFNKAQIGDSFSRDMDMQKWRRAAGHSLSAGMEKGIITDFAKKARSQLIREREKEISSGNSCACTGFSCLWSHQRAPLACGWFYSQSVFLCALRPQRTFATSKHE